MAGVKRRVCTDSDTRALHKELDEICCPICMEHPHNAVLLLCSSHDNGCRSYVCDTSYRHSNCLDRFKKLQESNNKNNPSQQPNSIETDLSLRPDLNEEALDLNEEDIQQVEADEDSSELGLSLSLNLKCPLCRGAVLGWEVVEDARKYLNSKRRSCSRDSCSFTGNYPELRRHARRIHPATRPSDIDPSRERAWRRLEHQRELGDVVSAIRSAMPGAVVVGDYVIENGDRLAGERSSGGGGSGGGEGNRPWMTTLFLFQMIDNAGESRAPRPRGWTRHRRSGGGGASGVSDRRFIWGENLLGLHDDDDEDEGDEDDLQILSEAGDEDASPVPRRRRRLTRLRSDEDQP